MVANPYQPSTWEAEGNIPLPAKGIMWEETIATTTKRLFFQKTKKNFSQAIKIVSSMISHINDTLLYIMCGTALFPFSVPPKTASSKWKHEENIRQIVTERHSAEHDTPLQTVKAIKVRRV